MFAAFHREALDLYPSDSRVYQAMPNLRIPLSIDRVQLLGQGFSTKAGLALAGLWVSLPGSRRPGGSVLWLASPPACMSQETEARRNVNLNRLSDVGSGMGATCSPEHRRQTNGI